MHNGIVKPTLDRLFEVCQSGSFLYLLPVPSGRCGTDLTANPNPLRLSDASGVVTPSSSAESTDTPSHAWAACSDHSAAANEPCAPSAQLLLELAQSPYDDGSLYGRLVGPPPASTDVHDRILVHTARAQGALDAFDDLCSSST